MNNIADQLQLAYHNLAQKCAELSVNADKIQLLAVSKTKAASDVMQAYHAGQCHFGENYPQELADKATELAHYNDICWHFIGPLQSNKTKLVAHSAQWVHSLDRLKIAQRLNEQRPDNLGKLNVLLQINISAEDSKAGVLPADVLPLARQISTLAQVELCGLMAIPAPAIAHDNSAAFAAMAQLSKTLQQEFPQATQLSMGMSDDWQQALIYGATMIRLGTAIFGARETHLYE